MRRDTRKPTRQDYLDALASQNPWHRLGRVPEFLAKPVQRPLAECLWKALGTKSSRYQVVIGPRRVGKTVTLYQTIAKLIHEGIPASRLWFLRLDHPLLMHYELGRWVQSLMRNYGASEESPLYLFLDEVNYSASWDKWLKTFYDDHWPVRVVATSSSTAALKNRTTESGIGRWSEQYLMPYSFPEFLRLRRLDPRTQSCAGRFVETVNGVIDGRIEHASLNAPLREFLLVGGFPELLGSLADSDLEGSLLNSQQVLRSEAVQRVAGMDIPQAFDVRNPLLLERLLYILAGQMCGLVNVTQLSKDLELSRMTVHQYIRYLEQAYLIVTLPNYSANEESVQRKGRKVFFVDGAVRNAALQRGLSPLLDPGEWGHLIENAAGSHLFAMSMQRGGRLFHWREGDREVDFVFSEGDEISAFEIATGAHDLSGLRAIRDRYPKLRHRCYLVTSGSAVQCAPHEDPDGIGRIPLIPFLIATGEYATAGLQARLGING